MRVRMFNSFASRVIALQSAPSNFKASAMDTELFDTPDIECRVSVAQRTDSTLTSGQQRVLELGVGDSFVLQAIRITDDVTAKERHQSAAQIVARLVRWAQNRKVRLTYRMIDKDTARVWRLGSV
jgi:hypothetical protein